MFRRALIVVAVLLIAPALLAENFVSFRGKFYVTYPDTWKQIDYLTVDAYLQQAGARRRMLDYEAVFAPIGSEPWYRESYLILTVDTLGKLSEKQIDSVLVRFEDSFEKPREIRSTANLFQGLSYGKIAYDPTTQTAAVISSEAGPETGDKSILLVMRFYEHGIANYYFYATDSTFGNYVQILSSVVASFSTENLEGAIPKGTAKIADPEKMAKATDIKEDKKMPIWAPTSGAVVVILIIALAAARRKRKQRQA